MRTTLNSNIIDRQNDSSKYGSTMKNPEEFLKNNWQKQPCFLKNGFEESLNYLTPEQLIDLSLDDEIESRLISNSSINNDWRLEHGPFENEHFEKLKDPAWTLLIQSIDSWRPETRKILESFKFIPNWRYDDLMVSFATDKGGVGPHVDNYDVFLIQAAGKRRWRVGQMNDIPSPAQSGSGLPHVESFDSIIDVEMEAGDILYIPPNTAHWGESIGESIGYSVGYRSPQVDSLLSSIGESINADYQLNPFFTDQYRQNCNDSAEIEDELIVWVQKQLRRLADNPELIKRSVAKQLSYSKFALTELSEPLVPTSLNINSILLLDRGFKANWVSLDNQILLSIEGESWSFGIKSRPAIEKLVSYEPFSIKLFNFSPDLIDFPESFTNLISTGYITLLK